MTYKLFEAVLYRLTYLVVAGAMVWALVDKELQLAFVFIFLMLAMSVQMIANKYTEE